MKTELLVLFGNIASITCAIAAGMLAYSGKDGWGWFLCAACVLCATVEIKGGGK